MTTTAHSAAIAPQVGVGPVGVAAVGVDRTRRQRPTLDTVQLDCQVRVESEGANAPPGEPTAERVLSHVAESAVSRRLEVDRRLPAAGRSRPGRLQELLAGRHQVVRTRVNALGVADQHVRVTRHQVEQQLHVVDENGRQRLHTLDRDALGQLGEHLGELGMLDRERSRPLTDVVGEQELAAGRCPQPSIERGERALIGDRE